MIPREHVRIVYSGVTDQRGQLHRKFNGPPFRVGLIGRIAPEKGHLDFIEAARRIPGARADVRFKSTARPSSPSRTRTYWNTRMG